MFDLLFIKLLYYSHTGLCSSLCDYLMSSVFLLAFTYSVFLLRVTLTSILPLSVLCESCRCFENREALSKTCSQRLI